MTTVTEIQGLEICPAKLSPDQVERYRRDGYLAFRDVLSPAEVEESRASLAELIQQGADRKETAQKFGNTSWIQFGESRYSIQFEPNFDPREMSDEEIDLKVRKLCRYSNETPIFRRLAQTHERIHGVLESLIGPAPILSQDMALIKPPFIGSEKPWHQDDAYFNIAPLDAVVGVWIALDEARIENGCMHMLPGGHKLGPLRHFHGRDCEIAEGRLNPGDAVPVEIPAGGALFFHGLIPHQTPPNTSPSRRRALQLHYRSAESRIVDQAEYDRIFAESDGSPASCVAARK